VTRGLLRLATVLTIDAAVAALPVLTSHTGRREWPTRSSGIPDLICPPVGTSDRHPAEDGGRTQICGPDDNSASWNRVFAFLRQLERLQLTA
jgi:hypothetical protein